jgi:hypothetical protein
MAFFSTLLFDGFKGTVFLSGLECSNGVEAKVLLPSVSAMWLWTARVDVLKYNHWDSGNGKANFVMRIQYYKKMTQSPVAEEGVCWLNSIWIPSLRVRKTSKSVVLQFVVHLSATARLFVTGNEMTRGSRRKEIDIQIHCCGFVPSLLHTDNLPPAATYFLCVISLALSFACIGTHNNKGMSPRFV